MDWTSVKDHALTTGTIFALTFITWTTFSLTCHDPPPMGVDLPSYAEMISPASFLKDKAFKYTGAVAASLYASYVFGKIEQQIGYEKFLKLTSSITAFTIITSIILNRCLEVPCPDIIIVLLTSVWLYSIKYLPEVENEALVAIVLNFPYMALVKHKYAFLGMLISVLTGMIGSSLVELTNLTSS